MLGLFVAPWKGVRMTAKKVELPAVESAPLTFRDYVGDIEDVPPVEVAYPQEPVTEPAKPATKKEN